MTQCDHIVFYHIISNHILIDYQINIIINQTWMNIRITSFSTYIFPTHLNKYQTNITGHHISDNGHIVFHHISIDIRPTSYHISSNGHILPFTFEWLADDIFCITSDWISDQQHYLSHEYLSKSDQHHYLHLKKYQTFIIHNLIILIITYPLAIRSTSISITLEIEYQINIIINQIWMNIRSASLFTISFSITSL